MAAALNASQCEVYTDVDGIYTADPRIVKNARKIDSIDFEEMLELASYGAKMHPRSIELGAVYNMPIYVASSFNDVRGTLICRKAGVDMEQRIKVTGVAYDRNVAKVTLQSLPDQPGIAASLFEPLSEVGISVDTIVQNTGLEGLTDLSFTVARTDLARTMEVIQPVAKYIKAGEVTNNPTLSKISIVGSAMQNAAGYASTMFRTLSDSGINIEMITTSEIRITCIISEDKVTDAVQALHRAFHLEDQ